MVSESRKSIWGFLRLLGFHPIPILVLEYNSVDWIDDEEVMCLMGTGIKKQKILGAYLLGRKAVHCMRLSLLKRSEDDYPGERQYAKNAVRYALAGLELAKDSLDLSIMEENYLIAANSLFHDGQYEHSISVAKEAMEKGVAVDALYEFEDIVFNARKAMAHKKLALEES